MVVACKPTHYMTIMLVTDSVYLRRSDWLSVKQLQKHH